MTERNLNIGSITFGSSSSGGGHASSSGYQPGVYTSTTTYATQWEHPEKYAELEKYFKKVFGDDAKKIVSLFDSNAISLEDHLASGYLAVDGGTVYGDVSIGKTLTVYDELYLGTKPVDSYLCPIGSIMPYAGQSVLPASLSGWLLCDGAAYGSTVYPGLYEIIGSSYNTTNGQSAPATGYFRVPDLRGMTLLGVNTAITDFNAIGKYGGAKTVALTTSEMPAHTHTQIAKYSGGTSSGAHVNLDTTINNNDYGYAQTGSTGSGSAHENMPPYVVINYLIKT